MAITSLDIQKTKKISPYFTINDKQQWVFIGDTLEVHIPKRYQIYDLLEISDHVRTLGVCRLVINNNTSANLSILNSITIYPSDMEDVVIDGVPYLVLYLNKNDVFMENANLIQTISTVYAIWVEFIVRGKPLYSLGYTDMAMIFDRITQLTGDDLGMDKSLLELVIAYLYRDPDNLALQYRFSNTKKKPFMVPESSIRRAPDSTTARVIGSYSSEGTVAALLVEEKENSELEDLYRGLYDPNRPDKEKDSIVGEI